MQHARARRLARRHCQGTLGSWCTGFHLQAPVPAVPPPRGNLTCSLDCNQVGLLHAQDLLMDCTSELQIACWRCTAQRIHVAGVHPRLRHVARTSAACPRAQCPHTQHPAPSGPAPNAGGHLQRPHRAVHLPCRLDRL